MSLKTQIIAAYKAKFPTVALSNARLEAIAERLDKKITEESEIDAKLDELNEIIPFADIAKQDDTIVGLKNKQKESKKADPPKGDPPKIEEPPKQEPPKEDDDTPAWAKALMQEVSSLKADKIVKSRIETAKERFKDIPKELKEDLLADINERNFQSDEEYEGFLTRKEKAMAFAVKTEQDGKFGKDKPFGGIGGNGSKVKEASDADVDEVFNQIKK